MARGLEAGGLCGGSVVVDEGRVLGLTVSQVPQEPVTAKSYRRKHINLSKVKVAKQECTNTQVKSR